MNAYATARVVALVVVLTFVLPGILLSQSTTTGSILGRVTDPTGAVIAGAELDLANKDTGEQWSTSSDGDGEFRIQLLEPGTYTLTIQSVGFAKREKVVAVEVGRVTRLDFALAVGSVAETVDVTTETPTVNTVQPDMSSNIDETSIENLPINGRRWSNFALLTPGAAPDGNFGLVSVRGTSGLQNNSTVDGADNNQAFFGEERGRTRISYVVSQSSVREFQVNSSNFSAEFGRAAGAVVNAVTKSGTNRLHGQAFYFLRDNQLGATNPFSMLSYQNSRGTWMTRAVKPEDRRQQFGVSVGGPLIQDRLFFFFTWDQQKRNFPALATAAKPELFAKPCILRRTSLHPSQYTNDCTYDDFRSLTNYVMPGNATDAQALAAFQDALRYLASFTGEVPRRADQLILFPKLDWQITRNHTAALSYNRMRWDSPGGAESRPVYNRGISSFGSDYVKVDTAIARVSSLLWETVANELRFQYSRDFQMQFAPAPASGEPATGPFGNSPQIAVAAYSYGLSFGQPNFLDRRAYPDERRLQVANTTTWQRGKHLLKAGFDLNRVRDRMDNLYQGGGSYSYSGRSGFIADYVAWKNAGVPGYKDDNRGYSSYIQAFGTPEFTFSTTDVAFFGQDEWRVAPRVTLSLGVRYELQKLPAAQIPNASVPQTAQIHEDANNFGPRVGFAWDVNGDGKTAVRGGYGMFYGRVTNSTISSALANTGTPEAQRSYVWRYNTPGAPAFPATVAVMNDPIGDPASAVRPDISFFAPDFQNPQIHQADLIVERQLAANTMVSASYLLSLGRSLPDFIDTNLDLASVVEADDPANPGYTFNGGPFDGSTLSIPYFGRRLNANYSRMTEIRSNVSSNYNALVLQVNRRMIRGLQYRFSYTWARAIDDGQNSVTFTAGNNIMFPGPFTYLLNGEPVKVTNGEHGTSNFDTRQRLVGSFLYVPQFYKRARGWRRAVFDGWAVSPIITISTGRPFSEYIGGTPNAIPDACTGCTGLFGAGGINRLPFVGRNSWRYPNLQNVDLRISKRLYPREGHRLEFLAEAFNLFNHVNVTDLADQMYSFSGNTLNYDSTFRQPTAAGNTIYRERQVQFGLKYDF